MRLVTTKPPQEPPLPQTRQERIRDVTRRMIAIHEAMLRKLAL
jgi:hypothetical protein